MKFRKKPLMEPVSDPSPETPQPPQFQQQRRVRLKAEAQRAWDSFTALPPERQRLVVRALLK